MIKNTQKKVKKELKKENKKRITKKEKTNNPILTKPYLIDKNKLTKEKNKKLITILGFVVVFIFSIIMLVLLCNRTFFRNSYKSNKININLPSMMFFKSDDGNKIVLKSLRKSKYLENFFDGELLKLKRYNCNGYSFYYDENSFAAIYNIKIEKDFFVKTVTIEYANGSAECLCNANTTGKNAELICKK